MGVDGERRKGCGRKERKIEIWMEKRVRGKEKIERLMEEKVGGIM